MTEELVDREVAKLIEKGKRRGYITYDEVNELLPDEHLRLVLGTKQNL